MSGFCLFVCLFVCFLCCFFVCLFVFSICNFVHACFFACAFICIILCIIMLQHSSNGMLPQQQQAHAVQDVFDQVPVVNGMNSLHLSEGQERARATVSPVSTSMFRMFRTHEESR
jgi:hypothetical protein